MGARRGRQLFGNRREAIPCRMYGLKVAYGFRRVRGMTRITHATIDRAHRSGARPTPSV
jgi:hypothetical protein